MDFHVEKTFAKQIVHLESPVFIWEKNIKNKKKLRNSVYVQKKELQSQREKHLNIKTTARDASFYALAPIMRKMYAEACPSQMLIIRIMQATLFLFSFKQQVPEGTKECNRLGEKNL